MKNVVLTCLVLSSLCVNKGEGKNVGFWDFFKSDSPLFVKVSTDVFEIIGNCELEDSNYKTGTKKWLEDVILPYCKKNRRFKYDSDKDKQGEIQGGGWDCNKFAREFQYWAVRLAWADYSISLPVGVVKYRRRDNVMHCIVCVYTSDKGMVYIEPRTGKFVQMTERERDSIVYRRF